MRSSLRKFIPGSRMGFRKLSKEEKMFKPALSMKTPLLPLKPENVDIIAISNGKKVITLNIEGKHSMYLKDEILFDRLNEAKATYTSRLGEFIKMHPSIFGICFISKKKLNQHIRYHFHLKV